ncbi:acyl-CoA dehydrogenase NM domain-like protein [Hesseltinella vesiculosa]|uniref:Acyl-CoA dehydrogenase NM domain-like protein n=1 Tax=Hesseltinella vesiculosa TaxID=101127 RepID=A0A1X2GLQ2_9FUNG|nr:acyl-CoA dehydrogenase NM domain-like protein [Hesseltinella vesiculosa]
MICIPRIPSKSWLSRASLQKNGHLVQASSKFARDEIIPVAAEHDSTVKYPTEPIAKAWKLGLVNTHIDTEYDGNGQGVLDSTLISEDLAYGCSGIQTTIETNNLAEAPLIVAGSEAQKKKYLGHVIHSLSPYEPGGGSDVAGLKTTAVKKGDKSVLNGNKSCITNVGYANLFFVFACTDMEANTGMAFTGFIVDADTPGVHFKKTKHNF